MTLQRVWMPSPNYSGRGGSGVRLIVCHTAEGARTFEDLGRYFGSGSSGVSSHVGIDDEQTNIIGEYVARPNKAWTQGNANPYSVSAELCAWANWTPTEWDQHPTMLANCAQWIAEEAAHFGLPIRRLSAAEAQGGGRGVCQHVDLGASGGGHWDCGPGFPMDRVLDMALGNNYQQPQPQPPPTHPERIEDLVPLSSMLDKDGNNVIYGVDDAGDLWEVTTKAADPNTPMTRTYRWSNITANGQNGHKLAKT